MQICDNFGDAPLVTTTAMDLPAKNTRREIFDFVENELIEVIPNLSEEVGGNYYGRMTKWAAKALLANLYLNAQVYINEARWNDCITQCDDIINSGKFTLAKITKIFLGPWVSKAVKKSFLQSLTTRISLRETVYLCFLGTVN